MKKGLSFIKPYSDERKYSLLSEMLLLYHESDDITI